MSFLKTNNLFKFAMTWHKACKGITTSSGNFWVKRLKRMTPPARPVIPEIVLEIKPEKIRKVTVIKSMWRLGSQNFDEFVYSGQKQFLQG